MKQLVSLVTVLVFMCGTLASFLKVEISAEINENGNVVATTSNNDLVYGIDINIVDTIVVSPDIYSYNYIEEKENFTNSANSNEAVLTAVGEDSCTLTAPADSLALNYNVSYEVVFEEKITTYTDTGGGFSVTIENLEKDTLYSITVTKTTDFYSIRNA